MSNENEQFDKSQRESAEAIDANTKKQKQLTDALADLIDSVDDSEHALKRADRGFKSLDKALESGRKSYNQIADDLANLADEIAQVTNAEEKARLSKELESKSAIARGAGWLKLITYTTAELSVGVSKIYTSVGKSAINSYQSNASAFQFAGDAAIAGIDSANETAQGISKTLTLVGTSMLAIPGASQAVAIGLQMAGQALSFFAQSSSDLAKFGTNVAMKELDTTVKSYRQASAAGALFADGLKELRASGVTALLTQDQFSQVIAENNTALAMYGGTVSNGVKQFTQVNKEMAGYRTGLLKLGYTVEDIAQGTADYMGLVAISGQANKKSATDLAKETDAYLTNLKAISAFTGEDAKKMAARARDASTQAAVYSKLAQMPGDAVKNRQKFEAMIGGLPPILQKAVQQQFAAGAITDPELAAALAQMPGAMELVNRASGYAADSTMDATKATDQLQSDIKALSPELQKQANAAGGTIGTATLLTGQYAELSKVIEAMQQLSIKGMNQQEKSTTDLVDKTKHSTEALTVAFADTEIEAQKLRIAIQNQLTPAITQFAKVAKEVLDDVYNKVDKLFGTPVTPGTGSAPGTAITGEVDLSGPVTPTPAPVTPTPGSGASPKGGTPGASVPGNLLNFAGGTGDQSHFDQLQGSVKDAFLSMLSDYGKSVTLTSAYRSAAEQQDIYNRWKKGDPSIHGRPPNPADGGSDSHMAGVGIDLRQQDIQALANSGLLGKYGFQQVSGDAVHIQKMAANGANLGPGETAIVGERGPEIVQGSGSVTSTASTSRIFNDMLGKLDEMVRVMKDHKDISEDLLHASV